MMHDSKIYFPLKDLLELAGPVTDSGFLVWLDPGTASLSFAFSAFFEAFSDPLGCSSVPFFFSLPSLLLNLLFFLLGFSFFLHYFCFFHHSLLLSLLILPHFEKSKVLVTGHVTLCSSNWPLNPLLCPRDLSDGLGSKAVVEHVLLCPKDGNLESEPASVDRIRNLLELLLLEQLLKVGLLLGRHHVKLIPISDNIKIIIQSHWKQESFLTSLTNEPSPRG